MLLGLAVRFAHTPIFYPIRSGLRTSSVASAASLTSTRSVASPQPVATQRVGFSKRVDRRVDSAAARVPWCHDPPDLFNPANASKIQLHPWPPGEMAFHNH